MKKQELNKLIFNFFLFYIVVLFFIMYIMYFKNVTDKTIYFVDSFNNFIHLDPTKLFYIFIIILFADIIFILIFSFPKLDNIQEDDVKNTQFGSAKWADKETIKENYTIKNNISQVGQGWVLGYYGLYDKWLLVDASDQNILVIAPPGARKSTNIVYPNIIHAMNNDELVIVTDIKNEIFNDMYATSQILNYNAIYIDFRNVYKSHKYNIMCTVNKYIDLYLLETDKNKKSKYKAKAQKYAKLISGSVVNSLGADAGQNQFFYDVAEGIVTSLILLISEYCDEKDRHIINVLKVTGESMEAEQDGEVTRTKLYSLMKHLDESDKITWFNKAAVNSDVRTAMNTFSTALSSMLDFVDDEIEQLICFNSDFEVEDFKTDHRYFIVVNIPEENKSRHFFGSLIISVLNNQLIQLADEYDDAKLPFIVREMLDEFGTMPKIANIPGTLTAARSRRIYIMLILQSLAQLKKNYGEEDAEVIKKACQKIMFSALSPGQFDEAEELSKALGNKTIKTGSISKENSNTKIYNPGQRSEQLQAKPLMFPDEIIRLKVGTWVVSRIGVDPMIVKTDNFTNMYQVPKRKIFFDTENIYQNVSMLKYSKVENNIMMLNSKEDIEIQSIKQVNAESKIYNFLEKNNKLDIIDKNDVLKKYILECYSNKSIGTDEFKELRKEI